jgi:natural product precursor
MKKLSKKLKLNKETISALTNEQMKNVKGGNTWTDLTFNLCGMTTNCGTITNTDPNEHFGDVCRD